MHIAVERLNIGIASFLIQAGANTTIEDKQGVTPQNLIKKRSYGNREKITNIVTDYVIGLRPVINNNNTESYSIGDKETLNHSWQSYCADKHQNISGIRRIGS